jgi:hypothetical protein
VRRLAALSVGLHALGLGVAALAMRPGTLAAPLEARIDFLSRWPPGWWIGWSLWLACALSLTALVVAAARRLGGQLARAAVWACAAGLLVDAACDAAQVTLCALAAAARADPGQRARFTAAAWLATVGGASLANGLYAIATTLITARARAARPVLALGVGLAIAAALMAVAGPLPIARPLEVASGATVALYAAWAIALARHLDGASSDVSGRSTARGAAT